jgi:hypothetical protein
VERLVGAGSAQALPQRLRQPLRDVLRLTGGQPLCERLERGAAGPFGLVGGRVRALRHRADEAVVIHRPPEVGRNADPSTALDGVRWRPNPYVVMPTRIVFDDGLEITVPESEDEVVLAVRRDHPNPVRLRADGSLYVNWDHIRLIEAATETP